MFTWLCGLYVYIVRSFCKSQDLTKTSPSSSERWELDKFQCTTRCQPCLSWVSMTKACCWSNWNDGSWRIFRFNHVQPIERIQVKFIPAHDCITMTKVDSWILNEFWCCSLSTFCGVRTSHCCKSSKTCMKGFTWRSGEYVLANGLRKIKSICMAYMISI